MAQKKSLNDALDTAPKIRKAGTPTATIYRQAVRDDYPDTYRLLCHNCNMARGIYGYCPHEREMESNLAA